MRFLPSIRAFAAYSAWFSLIFTLSLYATFPIQKVRGQIVSALEKALGKGKQGRHGSDPSVQIGKMALAKGLGVELKNVQLQLGSKTKDPGLLLNIDKLVVSTSVLGLLTNAPTADVEAKLYGGTANANLVLGNKKFEEDFFGVLKGLSSGRMKAEESLQEVVLHVDNLRLDRLPPLSALKGMPLGGTLKLDVDLKLGPNAAKEGEGEIALRIEGASVGPGEHPLAGAIPLVRIGELNLELPIEDGHAESKVASVNGQDLKADLNLGLTLSKRLTSSRLSGGGWFQLDQAFLNGDGSKLKLAYDLLPQLKRAKDSEEKVHFKLRGTLKSPGGSFDASKGQSKSKKKKSGRKKRNRSRREKK